MKYLLLLPLLLSVVACHPCKRGHNEPYYVEGRTVQDQPTVVRTGRHSSITIPHSHYEPGYTAQRWVCDEWEK